VVASRQYADKGAAVAFLEGVIAKLRETRELRIDEPILHVKMQIAAIHLDKGTHKDCKNLLDEGKATLDGMTDVDPTVHASFYWISSQYHKSLQEFAEFYKNALLFLAYTTVGTLSEPFKLVSFSQLTTTPIVVQKKPFYRVHICFSLKSARDVNSTDV
jgi:26S proteasome regulatory subunit N9